MGRSLREIYLHIIWGTKGRKPLLKGELELFVHRRIREICEESGLHSLAVNSAWNHVHTFTRWNTTLPFDKTVQKWKGRVSKEWNEKRADGLTSPKLKWQAGCGIFSVSPHEVDMMINYVGKQKRHHRERTTRHRHERW